MAHHLVVIRYARALYALAQEQKKRDKVAQDLQALSAAITENADLRRLVYSPVIDPASVLRAVQALADKGKADPLTRNFLGLLVENGRLDMVQDVTRALVDMIDAETGNQSATVTVASALDQQQLDALAASLKKMSGATVRLKMIIDPAILGGLIVQIGSKMIDNSVRRRLERLELAMKGTV